jgi:hypothetical protein
MRKTERITITSEGRDKGKTFILTEMPTDQGERLANRIIFALTNTGAAIPEEALGAGWAALAAVGVQAVGLLKSETVQPILDEAFSFCVRIIPPNPTLMPQEIFPGINSQIEEIGTRYTLHFAIWKMHTGFSMPVALPTSGSDSAGKIERGWISSMSHVLLGLLSRIGMRP